MQVDIDRAIEIEAEDFGKCFSTEDQKEGMTAFIEKRNKNFYNKQSEKMKYNELSKKLKYMQLSKNGCNIEEV